MLNPKLIYSLLLESGEQIFVYHRKKWHMEFLNDKAKRIAQPIITNNSRYVENEMKNFMSVNPWNELENILKS